MFGTGEEEPSGPNTTEVIKDTLFNIGGKIKDKATKVISKIKNDWESTN
jgi:hypothetical protein